jgi:hypothetical protein
MPGQNGDIWLRFYGVFIWFSAFFRGGAEIKKARKT